MVGHGGREIGEGNVMKSGRMMTNRKLEDRLPDRLQPNRHRDFASVNGDDDSCLVRAMVRHTGRSWDRSLERPIGAVSVSHSTASQPLAPESTLLPCSPCEI